MCIQIDSEAYFEVDFKNGSFVTIGPHFDKNHDYQCRPVVQPKECLGISAMKTLSITLHEVCLRELFLRGDDIGDEGAKYIADALTKTTSLELLILSNCSIGEKGIASLFASLTAKMLLRNSTLKFLLVSQNAHWPTPFTFHGHQRGRMFKISQESTTSLLNTDASEFYYGTKMSGSSIIENVEIPSTSELGHALWSGNMTEAATILELHQSPTGVGKINFHMSGNMWLLDYAKETIIGADEGLRDIRSIHSNPETWSKLTELNLTRKPLGSVGACLLAEILNQTQIQDLHVAGCCIGEEGVVSLANALSTNTTIKCLSIGGNEISKCGQDAIIEALSKNTVLTTLNIQKILLCGKEIAFSGNGDEDFIERFSKLPHARKLIT